MLGNIGLPELLIVLFIVLIIFGAGKLPKIAKAIGEGIKEFKKTQNEEIQENKNQTNEKKTDEEKK